jgi:Glyoxalase superfamily protein
MGLQILATIPVLRILDVPKALSFYMGFLGFKVDWEHRHGENFPLYMQISREGLVLHLTEHYGDCVPGGCAFFRVTGLREFHAELKGKDYRYFKPGVEETDRGSLLMGLLDPFGNKLRFEEAIEKK